jgi:glyoxylase-like metal-dependent hydrolase (beta-lactamase superfamily II)
MSRDRVVTISIPTPFPVGPVNVHLVKSEPVTLVDAGLNTDEAFDVLKAGFEREGLSLSDLQVVLLTHTHIDHVGLLGRLRDHADFTIYAHPGATHHRLNSEENQEEARKFGLRIMREFGAPDAIVQEAADEQHSYSEFATDAIVDEGVKDGETLGCYTVYHVPGHSALDILFVNHADRYAFTGDHVLEGTSPNPLLRRAKPGQERPKSLVQYRHSLQKTHDLDLEVCFPGHGKPIREHRAVIEALFARQNKRNERIMKILGERCMSVYDVARELFPRMETKYMYLGLSATVGHLEVLEEEGRVAYGHQDGILCFRAM